ncbi:MAG: tetratricopeptide repeat protein [Veillonella parvula]|nr:tetratricopeptide repeat protein [Veillonella parvula]
MAQYFTERLQKVFHMIFTSYNQKMAQEGLRQLELIINNQQGTVQTDHRALRNDMTTLLESDIDTKEDALKIANDPEARELGDAYALLARVYAGPRFTWEESNFPEDNMRTYQCLHDSIRRCSPIGTLQALRIKGSITPTVEKDMQISFDDAFRIVYDHANRGDAYCQYVIGNIFFWRDDNRIDSAEAMLTPPPMSWTKRIQRSLTANSVQDRIAALQGTVPDEKLQKNASNLAKEWFNKALDNDLAMFQGNLRNIYIDEADFSNARRVAKTAAELGNPAMMLYTGLDCHENGKFEDAFTWFTKGAALGQSESIAELADYYYHFYDAKNLRCTIPYDPVKAIGLYRRAATKEFSDAGYTALQAAFGYIFHIGHLPLDWGLIADLTHMAATKDRFMFALPYIGYMRIHGLGVTKNIRFGVQSLLRVLDEEQRAFEEENRVLFYDITRALTRVALGYAYEKGYVANLDPEIKDIPIDDEAEERLAAFEEVDGHWQYKEGIAESTTTVRPAPAAWPQDAARLSVTMDDFLWDTTLYDWQTIETALESQEEMKLSFYNRFLSIPDVLRNIFKLDVTRMLRNHYQVRLHGYDPTEGQEIVYKALFNKENTLSLLKELYHNRHLPSLEENWSIEKNEEKPTWHYVLDVDQQPFLLEEYDDANAMIQTALQGLKEKKYEQINIRTHDFVGPSYFIFKGNQSTPFRVQLYLKESARHTIDDDGNQRDTPGKTYLFEQYVGNEVSLNYWIQKTINTLEIPELDNWKQLTVPKDLQT